MAEIIFEGREEEGTAAAWPMRLATVSTGTQGETAEELLAMAMEAIRCYLDETMEAPKIIRLYFVLEGVLV